VRVVGNKQSARNGGWCPKGRRAEDGPIDAKYQLQESPSSSYLQRTEWNVQDSDGTVIFSIGERLIGGSLMTVEFAIIDRKPHRHSLAASKDNAAQELNNGFSRTISSRLYIALAINHWRSI